MRFLLFFAVLVAVIGCEGSPLSPPATVTSKVVPSTPPLPTPFPFPPPKIDTPSPTEEIPLAFDTEDPARALRWLARKAKPMDDVRHSNNMIAWDAAKKDLRWHLDTLRGKKINWIMAGGGVSKPGIGIPSISYSRKKDDPLPGEREKIPTEYMLAVKPSKQPSTAYRSLFPIDTTEPWVIRFRTGDKLRLQGEIKSVTHSVLSTPPSISECFTIEIDNHKVTLP